MPAGASGPPDGERPDSGHRANALQTRRARILCHDHDVTTSSGAEEALGLLRGGARYDVILCDLMMPQMTGMDLHAELERSIPEQAAVMVFLTGGAFTARAREFRDGAARRRIEKPFDLTALRAAIGEVLG